MVETPDDWSVQRTGICERRIDSKDVHASDMASAAAGNCLQGREISQELLVASSGACETCVPYQASIIANKLKFKKWSLLTSMPRVRDWCTAWLSPTAFCRRLDISPAL